MGQDCAAVCHWQGRSSAGRAWLEGDHLLFRGEFRLKLMLAEVTSAVAGNGRLSLTTPKGTAGLDIGTRAEDWAERIRHPKGLTDKLGLKPGDGVRLMGADPDPVLAAELAARGIAVDADGPAPWIILSAAGPGDLDLAPDAAAGLEPGGAVWVVFPKGRTSAVPQDAVFAAFRGAGLTDTKNCSVSALSTALKFVRRKGTV